MDDRDLKIERFNSGNGGQNQNKSPKNVRMTHVPTGTVVTVRGRHYHKNIAEAKRQMKKRIEDARLAEIASLKKAQRDVKIHDRTIVRTYDYKSGVVKDHRTGKKSSIKRVLEKGHIADLK